MTAAASTLTATAPVGLTAASAVEKAAEADPKLHATLHTVAKEFESILVRQLLEASKMGGDGHDGGYMAMAVDALASGVSQAGGLGLAQQIEEALSRGHGGAKGEGL
jgi:Rod binding domain-containing protein